MQPHPQPTTGPRIRAAQVDARRVLVRLADRIRIAIESMRNSDVAPVSPGETIAMIEGLERHLTGGAFATIPRLPRDHSETTPREPRASHRPG